VVAATAARQDDNIDLTGGACDDDSRARPALTTAPRAAADAAATRVSLLACLPSPGVGLSDDGRDDSTNQRGGACDDDFSRMTARLLEEEEEEEKEVSPLWGDSTSQRL
jgi:hypothetical protein